MSHFSVKKNEVTSARNRGYDDGLAGRSKQPPEGIQDKARSAYLDGYRRGTERRVEEATR